MTPSRHAAAPFLLILLPFAAGILWGDAVDGSGLLPVTVTIVALTLLFTVLNLFYKPLKIFNSDWLGALLAGIILLVFGIGNRLLHSDTDRANHFSKIKAEFLVVQISDEPLLKNDYLRFTANVNQVVNGKVRGSVSGKMQIILPANANKNLQYGDVLLVPAYYTGVRPPLNPGEFNYRKYLSRQNIYHQIFLSGKYAVLARDKGSPLKAAALALRKRLVSKLQSLIKDERASAVAATLILGYSANLDNDILQAYSKTGTIHILSVSGAHVGLIYLLLNLMFGFTGATTAGRASKTIIIISAIWAYAMLTGLSSPVCRAAIMLSFVVIGKASFRHVSTLNLLALSAFVMLLNDPLQIYQVGFQLSYLAVAGLIVLQPHIYKAFTVKNDHLNKLWMLCSVSIAAQLVTLPLSVLYFHQIPVYFLVSNLFILIPSALIMYVGIACIVLPSSWLITQKLGEMLGWLINFTNSGLTTLEHAPLATISPVWITVSECALLSAALLASIVFLQSRSRLWLYIVSVFLLLATTSMAIRLYKIRSNLEIVFFSLPKNKCVIFRKGNQAVAVTSLQTNSKIFRYSVQPYIDSCGVRDIKLIAPGINFHNQYFSIENRTAVFGSHKIKFMDGKDLSDLAGADIYFIDALRGSGGDKYHSFNHFNANETVIIGRVYGSTSNSVESINHPQNIKILYRNKAVVLPSN